MGKRGAFFHTSICILLAVYLAEHAERWHGNYATMALCNIYPNPTSHHEDIIKNFNGLAKARVSHVACECDRNFTRHHADSACPAPAIGGLMAAIDCLEILQNKRIAFLGDSVVRQEECNLRCLLRDAFISSQQKTYGAMSARVYLFQRNVSVLYVSIGSPWHDPVDPRAGIDLLFLDVDIIYWNIGNHYQDAVVLESALQSYADVYSSLDPSARPLNLFRLQAPPHFQTVDGHYKSSPLIGPFDRQICEANSTLLRSNHSFRYIVGLAFVLDNTIAFLDVSTVANQACYHPGNRDCLHYDQDSWILSAINSAMLQRLRFLLSLTYPCMHVGRM